MDKSICKGSLNHVLTKNIVDGYSKTHLKTMFGTQKPVTIKGTPDKFDQMVIDHGTGSSISGVQRKLFMEIEKGILVPNEQGQYIVKPTPKEFPSLSENEQCIMKLANAIGINTAQCSVIPFENGELAYVTKRFDIIQGTSYKHFIEDGASICQVAPQNKGSDALSYERCIKEMVNAFGGGHGGAIAALRLVLFSYLVGNNDLHLKNFSLIKYYKPSNKTHLLDGFAPVYDVLSVYPYPEYYTESLSLSLLESEVDAVYSSSYESYGYYTLHDFILLAQNFGVKEQVAQKIVMKIITDIENKCKGVLMNSNLPNHLKDLIIKRIIAACGMTKKPIIS
ncbi:type II toxin-antitoxin system HipA family toxin [Thalassotalea piscium]|uniref:Serine/threonine-protein kinase HipA n=1 Tax=Thalassotalea piscium TaxID=1230533 RepID=A0A7X0TSV1_9GAMM|nr:HipA domain-containing protein [Thalassotalea piscium]MBB6542533.1 serine/threonine-protein kinase HipA [Thalassotalea piscium]